LEGTPEPGPALKGKDHGAVYPILNFAGKSEPSAMPDFSRLLAVCKEVSSLSATNPVDCKGHSLFLLQ